MICLYSPRIREGVFPETHIQLCESLGVRIGANRLFCPTLGAVGDTTCSAPEYLCSRGGPSHYRATGETTYSKKTPPVCRTFRSALGRTRTCDLLIRSHSPSETRADTGRQNSAFIRFLALLEGQGRHPVAVRLRSKPEISRRVLEPEVAEGYQKAPSRQLGE
jgi:hypothetical protein